MDSNLALFNMLGGVCLLLYGIRLATSGIERAAGARLRRVLTSVTRHRITALLAGAGITALLQSSGAATALLVSLVDAGLLSLEQSMAIILGADVGGTLTVQLVASHLTDYATLFVATGIAITLCAGRKVFRHLGEAVLGFGFLLLGLKILIDATAPLRSSLLFQQLLVDLGGAPVLLVLVSAGFTAIVQSGTATIGLAIALAMQNLMPLHVAVPIVIGANVGTCATAVLSSLGGCADARRVAVAHLGFKALGALIFLPLSSPLAQVVSSSAPDIPRQIANTHTVINITIALLFLPFTGHFAHLARALVADDDSSGDPKQLKYLDETALGNPAMALRQASRETLRVADLVHEMLRDALLVFRGSDESLAIRLQDRDDLVDGLVEGIKRCMTRLAEQGLTPEQSKRQVGLLLVAQDLENIGDTVDKNLMELAKKKITRGLTFSHEGARDIERLHSLVLENLTLAISALASQDSELAADVLAHKKEVQHVERELREAHIKRLNDGVKETIETSSIHLDVLGNLERINFNTSNLAWAVLGEADYQA